MKKLSFVGLLIVLLGPLSSMSQTAGVQIVSSHLEFANDTTGANGNLIDFPRRAILNVSIPSLNNVQAVVLTVGSSNGSNDLSIQAFPVSGQNIPTGSQVTFGNGIVAIESAPFSASALYFVGVYLKYANLSESEIVTTSLN
jgi:hypothetical protein